MTDERTPPSRGDTGSGGSGDDFGRDEPTKPGIGPEDTFSTIAGALNRSVAALKESAGLVTSIRGPTRWVAIRRIGIIAHQVSDMAEDFGYACMALAKEEEKKHKKERRR